MAEFRMPSLGADMEDGTLYEWHVKPGDTVKRSDIVAAVETDKGIIDIEVFEDGVVGEIMVLEGECVPVGTVLALIVGEGETVEVVAATPAAADHHPMDQRPLVQPAKGVTPSTNGKRLRISPVAQRRAKELNIDLSNVQGTGPGGAIGLADVEKAAETESVAERLRVTPVARRMAADLDVDLHELEGTGPHGVIDRADVVRAAEQEKPVAEPPALSVVAKKPAVDFQTGMRRAIAAAMSRSNREIPHYYLETQIDMTAALRWLEAENLKRPLKERLLPVVLLIKATANALSGVPQLNGFWLDDQFQPQEAIHIGFAIALRQGGLVTPAIHHADIKSLDEIMTAVRDLIMRTRGGRLRSSELTDPTITLTSLGDRGVEKVYGVIYPPQVALVGFGKITDRPWTENGMLGVRTAVTVTLAADHRASDGHLGGLFLEMLNKQLQEVEKL